MSRPDGPEADAATARLAEIVRRSVAGDADAFRELVELKRDQVFRVAYQHCGDAEEARNIAQSVFVRLWQNLHRYDPDRRFDTWLYQVTVNASIDHHRRRKHRLVEQEFDETFTPGLAADIDERPEAERLAEAREIQGILLELSAELTDKQRSAFLLREVEGLSTGEVAEALAMTESTVRNHVFQARKVLREALVRRYPEYAGRAARGREESP